MSPRLLVGFVRSVAVLGLPADAQVAYLGRLFGGIAPVVDELALDFEDGLRLVPAFIERSWLSTTALAALEQLDAQLGMMGGQHHAELWSVDGLAREEWGRVRILARAALGELN